MKLYTYGISGKSAEQFFETIKSSGANKILDTRINRSSQLAGFAKDRDLSYFSKNLAHIDYEIAPYLAPTKQLLKDYRDGKIDWSHYSSQYLQLIRDRKVENTHPSILDNSIFLCSEDSPIYCHRRLAAEYLAHQIPGTSIIHL